ncbi:flagellar motor protein [Sinimarinibacterium sp. CAU 1509]|uniref:flagellar motor protein n=1 Tax=Sinimarinibacterium sp. CAU 1509 TaxID=2562283 RepID=UPI0010AC848B|nr:flagellar motor protein [Sinimarinibacterium sp. CAU 1509]TJY62834.1 flagellar motor protein [Sinimarinibacterium sp. CAU 1509]
MDKLSVIGVVLALFAIVGGSILKGAGVGGLVNPAAFVIVLIGTLAAIMLHTPVSTFKHAMKIVRWTFKPPQHDAQGLIERIVEWSGIARKQGLLALEGTVEAESDPFIKKGLQMLVDGAEPDAIRNILEVELQTREHFDQQGAKVFEGMGIYAPTLGIIGAVLGLMAVMKNLADPSKLGHGIAAAFTATIYGIASANLFFLPIAAKLKSTIAEQTRIREMTIEGLISISQGENPRNIESKLKGYLH